MERSNKKADLIEAAMQIIAEDGLVSFTMKKVTKRVGVSEALVYRHFETKDNLLNTCYESVHRQVAYLYANMPLPVLETEQDLYRTAHDMWMRYFTFLVENTYRTIFYFEYRDSPYIRQIMSEDTRAQETYFANFVNLFNLFNNKFRIYEKVGKHHLWTYILDTTGLFAKRVILGELPNTPESAEYIWRLISGGILGLFQNQM